MVSSASPSPVTSPANNEEKLAVGIRDDSEAHPTEHGESHDEPDGCGRKIKGLSWVIVVLALLSSTFLYALDNTVIATVRPSIVETFGGRVDMLPWISVAYPMGEVGANPLWGKLTSHFNNKMLYLGAVLIFEIGSAVTGAAPTIEALIVGRAIAGFGGSGIYVGTINIITAMTVAWERAKYLNFVGMAWSLGTILGPFIGGAFADSNATWRWAFYINIVIAAFAAPACIFLVPPVRPPHTANIRERLGKIDYVGAFLFLGGVVSIVMVLGFGGATYDWRSKQMIGLYVATFIAWTAFTVQQRFNLLTVDRIFPAQLVADWEMDILFAWTAVAIANVVVTIYSIPLFYQFGYNYSSLRAALYTLPFIAAALAGAGAGGPLFARFSCYKIWFTGASILMLVGNGLLTTLDYQTSRGALFGFTIIQGLGVGPVIQLGYTVGQVKAPKAKVPQVTAFLTCAQMAGLALSLGIATSVFLNEATAGIVKILPGVPRSQIQEMIDGANNEVLNGLSGETRQEIAEVVARNLGKVFYLNLAGAALGFITSLFLRRENLELKNN
ncbi:MFS general substrate transporter [Xylariomycetidae sp. FL0641]|nr:MFS general substrate transporter [Xylariomycetidae sp. FL0641]